MTETRSEDHTGETRGGRKRIVLLAVSIGLLLIGAALIAYPFLPRIKYALLKPEPQFPYQSRLIDENPELASLPETAFKPVPEDNRLVIPKIGVDVAIVEGADQNALNRGIWHIPDTSNPTLGGNTVLSGHRFQYLPPSSQTLYLLDKLETHDDIIIYWEGKEYDYKVTGRDIILPTQVEILENTSNAQLTLFTCTPLFTTSKRLVIFSEQVS
ncbi:MAG: sortase [Patescibacteria group bacterium]|jgi:LPXTG-site transpeptidase (sortase) family protein